MVLVSDDRNHTKYSVYVFIQHIINHLKLKSPSIEHLDIFTDGASSQFKQRYLFSNLYAREQEHDLKIKWHFFATSHGKGVVDGLGGTVKRSVWRHVRSGQVHITTPEQYAQAAKERNPAIHIKFISKTSIEQMCAFLDAKWEGVRAVPQTHKMHCYFAISHTQLRVAETSDSSEFKVATIRKSDSESDSEVEERESLTLTIGQWVVVTYDESNYPGEVTNVEDSENFEISVMHRSGQFWKWPKTEDKIVYCRDSIIKVINPPKAAGHRGQFTFNEHI